MLSINVGEDKAMAIELSYVIMTPYTVMKSRTGGVISRLLSRTDLEFIGARILPFSDELANRYAKSLLDTVSKRDPQVAQLLSDYVRENFSPVDGKSERTMVFLFRGEDACRKLSAVVGNLSPLASRKYVAGATIRDTFADYVVDKSGAVKYFEPAVLTPPNMEEALPKLQMFSEYMKTLPNVVKSFVGVNSNDERTLVIIKPDNWRHPSSKPGGIIDMLSRTGLRIVGAKLYQMSVAEALEFYGPVKDALRRKLAPMIGGKAKTLLEKEFNIKLKEGIDAKLTELVGFDFADDQFAQIVEFMSGRRPESCPNFELNDKGRVKCLVMIYEGENAISKIRDVLGPTDPTKAPGGTVRCDYGYNVMVNTAHASDSKENAAREMNIVKIEKNDMTDIISAYLNDRKK